MDFSKIPKIDQRPSTLAELRAACLSESNPSDTETKRTLDKNLHRTRFLVGQLKDVMRRLEEYNDWFLPGDLDLGVGADPDKMASRNAIVAMRYRIDAFCDLEKRYTEGGPNLPKEAKKVIEKLLKIMKAFGVETPHTPYAQTRDWAKHLSDAGLSMLESTAIELDVIYTSFLAAEIEKDKHVHEFKKSFGGGMR